jgi:hypothetical protein
MGTQNTRSLTIALAVSAFCSGLIFDGDVGHLLKAGSPVSDAMARVGRPATPGSVAGVARRTTRRVVRRSTIYVSTLPAGCVVTTINGGKYWHCGGTYYAHSGGRYVVVYVN